MRKSFLIIFIATNCSFVLLHLYKQSQIIKYSYLKQKLDIEKTTLSKQKQELIHKSSMLHDRCRVKEFAQAQLGLKPVKISQIKKVTYDTNL